MDGRKKRETQGRERERYWAVVGKIIYVFRFENHKMVSLSWTLETGEYIYVR